MDDPTTPPPSATRVRTAATERGYAEDWARFEHWCAVMAARPLPADPLVVMFYLGYLAPTWRPATAADPPEAVTAHGEVCETPGLAPATLVRHLAAIAAHHVDAGHPTPTRDPRVLDMLDRVRERAADPSTRRRVAPVVPEQLRALVTRPAGPGTIDRDPVVARDTALILLGWAAALRRREIAALTLDQIREDPAGAWIDVLSTPADPDAADRWAASTRVAATGDDTCPVAAWRRWRAWLPEAAPTRDAAPPPGAEATGVPAFRAIRKGLLGTDTPAARSAARERIGRTALTERSVARIVRARADGAGLSGQWTAGRLRRHDALPVEGSVRDAPRPRRAAPPR